jgi:hypothetical protein
MSLKKFEDFENHIKEEDKNAHANDSIGATKDLLTNARIQHRNALTRKVCMTFANGDNPGEITIKFTRNEDEDITVLVKVIGYLD